MPRIFGTFSHTASGAGIRRECTNRDLVFESAQFLLATFVSVGDHAEIVCKGVLSNDFEQFYRN